MKTLLIALVFPLLAGAKDFTAPKLRINVAPTRSTFDQYWCKSSMVDVQDPIFRDISRSRFNVDPKTDELVVPDEWYKEANEKRVPALKKAAEKRWPQLLGTAMKLVGRPFDKKEFDYFFFLCPSFGLGNAYSSTFPFFMYLESAVGNQRWDDWLFTDQYLFHEVLHAYVAERVDYTKGTAILNYLYGVLIADKVFEAKSKKYLGYPDPITPEYQERWEKTDQIESTYLVLVHTHLYALLYTTFKTIGEEDVGKKIREYEVNNANPHPSYVKAWEYATEIMKSPTNTKALFKELM